MNRRNFLNRPLTDEEIKEVAPSAFAIQPWHGVSSRYTFIPTSAVIAGMRAAGFFPFSAIQSRTKIEEKLGFTRHQLRFRSLDQSLNVVGDTAVEAVVTNAHDRAACYEISLGAFRLSCLNGAMVSEGVAEIFRVRHTGNVISEVVEATKRILGFAPQVIEAIKNWKGIQLSEAERLAFATSAYQLRFEDAAPAGIQPATLLETRRYADNAKDLWSTYNVVEENCTRGGLIPRDNTGRRLRDEETGNRARKTRGLNGITQSANLKRALWTLADEMRKIKEG